MIAVCEICKKNPAIARILIVDEGQFLVCQECLGTKEVKRKVKNEKVYASPKDLINDLYKRSRDPTLTKKERKDAQDKIDKLWEAFVEAMRKAPDGTIIEIDYNDPMYDE